MLHDVKKPQENRKNVLKSKKKLNYENCKYL